MFGHMGARLGTRKGILAPRRIFGHAGARLGTRAGILVLGRTLGNEGGHFSAPAHIWTRGRAFWLLLVFVQAGRYFVQNDSKMSKIRLIILYSESYTIIGHFCPKPFGLFVVDFYLLLFLKKEP